MTRFTATTESDAIVPADRMDIWRALTDPVLLPQLTPLLRRIDADGDIWTWHMTRISALGVSISPSFTEQMTFAEGSRIEYTHQPPNGTRERAGAEGWYDLDDADGGTRLKISLTLEVDLPLPRSAGPAVRRVMQATMNRMGDKFSANLMHHLGLEPDAALSA
jgi:carbon monoxide dehydrogenase subunit G